MNKKYINYQIVFKNVKSFVLADMRSGELKDQCIY